MKKLLKDLLASIDHYKLYGEDIRVCGVTDDSRKVRKGYLFIAVAGLTSDGHDYIAQAIKNGAVAVVGERIPKKADVSKITFVKIRDSRLALGQIASAWYLHPSKKLKIIGVTGTDGKTTTSTLIYWILKTAGKRVGLISTVSARIGDKDYDTGFHVTNPEPLTLHKFLSEMVDRGCEYVVLEVTSHGLDQGRVSGINFDIGVLTNITHEHIDYHKTFANYVKVKAKLFNNSKISVLNYEYSHLVAKHIKAKVKKLIYDDKYLKGEVKRAVSQKFPEVYNRLNSAAAVCAVREIGISDKDIVRSIRTFPGIPGRMEEIKNSRGFPTIVDFAHTPNALSEVLTSLNKSKGKGRLIAVFGSAGERDIKKRSMMPKVSASIADFSIFTAEDPRSEGINDMLEVMCRAAEKVGAKKNKDFVAIPERGEAIYYAINKVAKRGDTVVICGKGHEKSMSYDGVEYPWSDQEAVKMALGGKLKEIIRPKASLDLKGKNVAVLGLGLEGRDLVGFLLEQGAIVTILDQKSAKELDFSGIDKNKVKLITGRKYLSGLEKFEIIFRSPGIYRYKPEIVKAEKSGVIISSALKLFFDFCPAKIIGVTGTKGKGTTSTLIYEILKRDGKDVYLVGNIGKAYMELIPKLSEKSWVVMELSSFQLIDIDKSPNISVVLNITSDHMDWHKNQKEYVEAKKNIVRYQKSTDFAVINFDYEASKNFSEETLANKFFVSSKDKVHGVYVKNSKIVLSIDRKIVIGSVDKLLLRGEHNWENVTAGVCAAKLAGAKISSIKKTVFSFKGLEHRLELVRAVGEVTFYNDSFATGPQPTLAALKSFSEPITIILGGYDKGLDYGELCKYISKSNVRVVILIGDLAHSIDKELKKVNYKGTIINLGTSKMPKIVKTAYENTKSGGVVILSPAAASFDMFKDYKDRGNQFKDQVRLI